MYRCTKCNQLSVPGDPAIRVVVETRRKIYPARPEAMRRGKGLTLRFIPDPGGVGTETVREELRHERCA